MYKVIRVQPGQDHYNATVAKVIENQTLTEFVSNFTDFAAWEEIPEDLQRTFMYEYQDFTVQLLTHLKASPKSIFKVNWGNSQESFIYAVNEIKRIVKSADKIRAFFKGCIQRKKYYKLVLKASNGKDLVREKKSNAFVVKSIAQTVGLLKLNLEQCFRAADQDSDGVVTHAELKNFLDHLQLAIPQSYITRFLMIIDEDCSGTITRREFYNTLSAYQQEKESQSESGRVYQQEVLLKFSEVLKKREIEADEMFSLCDIDMSGKITLKELEKYIAILNIGFKDKEVVALMTLLDSNGNGEITREEFFEYIERGNKALFEIEGVKGTEAAIGNSLSPSFVISKLEPGKTTLFDLLDLCGERVSLGDFKKILKNLVPGLTETELATVQSEISKSPQSFLTKTQIEDFCICNTETNMLTKSQYIKKLALTLQKNSWTFKNLTEKEAIRGVIEKEKLSMLLKKYFKFTQGQVLRCLNLLEINDFTTSEALQNVLQGTSPVEIFSRSLKENNLTLQDFFELADKKRLGVISSSNFELTAAIELRNIDGRVLTDLALMFPMPRIDKSAFFKIFQSEKPSLPFPAPANPPPVEKIQEVQPVAPEFKRRSTLFVIGSDKAGDSFRKFLSNCDKAIPTHVFFEKYSVVLHQIYSIERFNSLCSIFRIPKVEADDIFRTIDKDRIGYIYAYSLILVLDNLRNVIDKLPTLDNFSASAESKGIMQDLLGKCDPGLPLYKNFPGLSKIVDWETVFSNSSSKKDREIVESSFPVPCYYYHLCAVLQTHQKIEYLCGEQVIAAVIERNKITEQAGDYFSKIACETKTNKKDFIHKLSEYCNKMEAASIYQSVYKDEENKPFYVFFTLFDCVQTAARNKLQGTPELPLQNSTKVDINTAAYFKKLGQCLSKPLISFNFTLLDENNEIGFAQAFERQLKVPKTDSLQYLKLFKLANDHKIRLYHIIFVVDSYRTQGVTTVNSYFSEVFHERFPYGASLIYSIGMCLRQQIPISALSTALNFLSESDIRLFLTNFSTQSRGFVFGYEIAAEIDKFNSEPIAKELPEALSKVVSGFTAKSLDYEENILKEIVDFKRFSEITSGNLNSSIGESLWNHLKPTGQSKFPFYFFPAFMAKFVEFNKQADAQDDVRVIGLLVAENILSTELLFEFQLQVIYEVSEVVKKLVEKLKIDQFLAVEFLKLVDTRKSGKVFGFELITWMDTVRGCVKNLKIASNLLALPFSNNAATAKSLQQSLKIIASDLDFNNKSTFAQYSQLESLKVLTLNNLITAFTEIPESNIRELYLSLNILPTGVLFYHIMAVVESYRVKQVFESVPQNLIKASEPNKANIQQAKIKLREYLKGDNPKKRQLTSKEVFGMFDKNGDGVISSEEFMSCLDMMRVNLTANEKIILTRDVDKNHDDKINYEEIMEFLEESGNAGTEIVGIDFSVGSFKEGTLDMAIFKLKQYMKNNETGVNALEKVFDRLDEDRSAGLNDTEFEISLSRLKLSFSPSQVKGLKQLCPLTPRGEIPYLDFCKAIRIYKFSLLLGTQSIPPPSNIAPSQVNQEKEFRIFDYKLSQKDYFTKSIKGCTTILNSEDAAIRRCFDLFSASKHFLDPDFGPEKGDRGDICLYWDGTPPGSNYPPASELSWKSPSEWLENVGFFKGGISSNDVIQGSLGDCWFIGALSVFAQRDELVRGSIDNLKKESQITQENALGISKGVYPPLFHSLASKGMFVFRFFIDCAWRWVIIDDRIPVFDSEGSEPQYVFGHCNDSTELWVSLIEKAYAKAYGCYQALNGGLIDDALVDLTGYVAEKTKVLCKNIEQVEALWNSLKKYRTDHCLMGCSIDAEGVESDVIRDGEITGLLARHAYAIIDVIQIADPNAPKKRHRLIRLRNPWGQREWNGKWSDGSEEVKIHIEKLQNELKKIGSDEDYDPNNSNDGSFLMSFKDWRNIYHNLYACVDFSENWWGVRFSDEWNPNNSGGVPMSASKQDALNWAKNPQFIVDLKSNAEIFISLSQQDGRYVKDSVFPFEGVIKTACFTVMKLAPTDDNAKVFDQSKITKLSVLKLHRTIELRLSLAIGKYCIVPATMKAGETGVFWLSIYLSCNKTQANVYAAADKRQGNLIEEEEEFTVDKLTPRLLEGIKDLVKTITTLK